ncbi:MAG: heavy metal-responsive transcriptional regulator [Acidobacteriota bacterium]|nr:heavy metal-responsive transcriptional regulator [Acidobacteriota bacterium]
MSQRPLQIGQLAARVGVTVDTLRYYERVGLLRRPARSAGGFRTYSTAALERLQLIRQAKAQGLTLAEIRRLVSYLDHSGTQEHCRQVRALLASKLNEIERKRAELEAFRQTLLDHLRACDAALAKTPDPACPVAEEFRRT